MNKPIMITPHDIWNIMLAVCAGIVSISAAFAVILKIVEHLRQPDKKQDDRISNLETKVGAIEERLQKGNEHFECHDNQMKRLEDTMKKSNMLIIESLKVLIEHDIDGNNIDRLKDTSHRIDKFLLEK